MGSGEVAPWGVEMASPVVLGTGIAGAACLALGLMAGWKDAAAAYGLDKIIALACAFYAAPLAAFGAEHLTDPATIAQIVPPWMPARLFWAYFVGVALLAAGLSISLKRYLRLTGALTALMFFLFVAMMHLPSVIRSPHDRIAWAIFFRDLSFGCGALALAGAMSPRQYLDLDKLPVVVARILIAVAMIVYGVEHFLHPVTAIGVPLKRPTPAWMPLAHMWAYVTGAILLFAGIAILINRFTREAAAWAGLWILIVTFGFYVPILITARSNADLLVGLNYVFDTMLYAGAILLLAGAVSPGFADAGSRRTSLVAHGIV